MFCVATLPLSAQLEYEADPTNYLQVAEDIYKDYELPLTISQTDIEDYLEDMVNIPNYNSNCVAPKIYVDGFVGSTVNLSWNNNGGFNSYEVSYLNLNDGSHSVKIETGNSTSFSNLSPGLYSFAISAICTDPSGVQASKLNIIIGDYIVMFQLPDNEICCCTSETTMVLEDFTNTYVPNSFEVYVGNEIYGIEGVYKLKLTYDDESQRSVIFEYGETNPPYWAHKLDDLELIDFNGQTNNIFLADYYSNSGFTANFYYDEFGMWTFNKFQQNLIKVEIKTCEQEGGTNGGGRNKSIENLNERIDLQIFPNPATQFVQINSRSNKTGMLTISNHLGQEMYINDLAFNKEQVNVHEWPQGVYYVKLNVNGRIFQETFVKTNN